jgi:hypothetical protein
MIALIRRQHIESAVATAGSSIAGLVAATASFAPPSPERVRGTGITVMIKK